MSELTLFLFQMAFLGLLWFFVFFIVYALRVDIFGERVRQLINSQNEAPLVNTHIGTPQNVKKPKSGRGSKLVIISGPKEGLEIQLSDEPLTIGRSPESGLVLRDEYTSTHHARLIPGPDAWMLQDLDSTNGTRLGGKPIKGSVKLNVGSVIQIGTTSFELRS